MNQPFELATKHRVESKNSSASLYLEERGNTQTLSVDYNRRQQLMDSMDGWASGRPDQWQTGEQFERKNKKQDQVSAQTGEGEH